MRRNLKKNGNGGTVAEYQRIFYEWKKQALKDIETNGFTIVKSKNGEEYKIYKEELGTFIQCYKSNEKGKYRLARRQMPKQWYISTSTAVMLSIVQGKVKWIESFDDKSKRIKPQITVEWQGEKYIVEISNDAVLSICTNGKASKKATKELEKKGLICFSKPYNDDKCRVELHHTKGLEKSRLKKHRKQNAKYNQFVMVSEHKVLNGLGGKKTVKNIMEDKTITEPLAFVENRATGETYVTDIDILNKLDNVKGIEYMGINYTLYYCDKLGNPIASEDVPEPIERKLLEIKKSITTFEQLQQYTTPLFVGKLGNKEFYVKADGKAE